jgi:hypothetical protein
VVLRVEQCRVMRFRVDHAPRRENAPHFPAFFDDFDSLSNITPAIIQPLRVGKNKGIQIPWREAGPPNHLDNEVDSDQ